MSEVIWKHFISDVPSIFWQKFLGRPIMVMMIICGLQFQTIPDISVFRGPIHFVLKCKNFERTFTSRGWFYSASSFGKTNFGWFPTFHFLMPKNNGQKMLFKIISLKIGQTACFPESLTRVVFRQGCISTWFLKNMFFLVTFHYDHPKSKN